MRMLRHLSLIAALLSAAPAWAQLPPGGALIVNQTQIQGGSAGQCLFINSATTPNSVGAQACGGSGTVTSVSVVTANGVSGSVATATTTPAITLTLGAITPTTVNGNTLTTGTGTLTLGSVTLNAGAGGTLGSNAFTSTAYLPLTGGTLTGGLLFSADNTIDIGASGATRPRTGYFGTSILSPLHAGGTAAFATLILESTSGAGTTDAILFKTGSQSDRMQIATGGQVNIGPNVAATATFTVNLNTVAPSSIGSPSLQLNGADGAASFFAIDNYGLATNKFGVLTLRAARGSGAAFTASLNGDSFGIVGFIGASAANTFVNQAGGNGGAFIAGSATQDWSSVNQGSQLKFFITPNSTAAIALGMTLQNSGGLNIGSTAAVLAASEVGLNKVSASGSAPGAGTLKFAAVAGTNAGSCKIITYAGTSTTPVTIVDNVGTGC